ncbi:hypothetical protein K435DRAFT_810468 [Dendrothele bispora CBS 962.96]|uniref:Uncharacterized protein n=1 Tax=Dendrothele bispora (strain CBS 962.96) TaxID=1314807 RepID=A0A4S8KV85_DENBC|nr:hypothetical protein K435DRAFT_810468 [Dendrothele bispora CBS 962.96]
METVRGTPPQETNNTTDLPNTCTIPVLDTQTMKPSEKSETAEHDTKEQMQLLEDRDEQLAAQGKQVNQVHSFFADKAELCGFYHSAEFRWNGYQHGNKSYSFEEGLSVCVCGGGGPPSKHPSEGGLYYSRGRLQPVLKRGCNNRGMYLDYAWWLLDALHTSELNLGPAMFCW